MRKIGIILGLFFLFSAYTFGQNIKEVNGLFLTPDSKPYSGKYTNKFEDGNIMMEMFLKKGMKDGQAKFFYPNGQLKEIRAYQKNQMHGTWIVYSENGVKTSVANYRKGLKHGKWMIWNEEGQLIYDLQYKSGEKTGIWKIYNDAGDLINERDYSSVEK